MAESPAHREIFGGREAVRNRRAAAAASVLCVTALVAPLVWTLGALPVDIPFPDGVAWLSNEVDGEIVQVNGQTGQLQAALEIDGREADISQSDRVVIVEVDGEFHSVDLALLDWRGSTDATGEVVIGEDEAGKPVVYVVEPTGLVQQLDPLTLETLGETTLDGAPGPATIVDGRLFVAVDGADEGTVQVVDDAELVTRVPVGRTGDRVELSRVGRDLIVLNLSREQLISLDPAADTPEVEDDDRAGVDLPGGEVLLPDEAPAGHLWIAALAEGRLLAVDTTTGEVAASIEVADPRSDLVGPVLLDDLVYVVDRTAGVLVRVDADSLTERDRQDLSGYGIEESSGIELMAQGGRVFLNDPSGPMAVVYGNDGSYRVINKNTAAGSEGLSAMPASEFVVGRREDDVGDESEPGTVRPAREAAPGPVNSDLAVQANVPWMPDPPAPPAPGPEAPGPETPEPPELPEVPEVPDVPEDPEDPDETPQDPDDPEDPPPEDPEDPETPPDDPAQPEPAPEPPSDDDVLVWAGDTYVDVSWAPVDGAVGYRLNSGQGWAESDRATSHRCWELTNGETYTVQIVAVYADGTESEAFGNKQVTPQEGAETPEWPLPQPGA